MELRSRATLRRAVRQRTAAGLKPRVGSGGFMPFKSQAQRRKFAQLLVEGKISDKTFEEWNRETGSKRLPERVRRKTKRSAKRASARPRRKRSSK
jgi:hypothetical protein